MSAKTKAATFTLPATIGYCSATSVETGETITFDDLVFEGGYYETADGLAFRPRNWDLLVGGPAVDRLWAAQKALEQAYHDLLRDPAVAEQVRAARDAGKWGSLVPETEETS